MSADEIWKDIAGHEGRYQVSNMGRVKSLVKPYRRTEKVLKGSPNTTGYILVQLRNGGKDKFSLLVHRLVMMAFEPRENMRDLEVNHKDLDTSNNKLSNLEWMTARENKDHFYASSKFKDNPRTKTTGSNHHLSKLTDDKVIEMRKRWEEVGGAYGQTSKIAREFGVSEGAVRQIVKGETWKHLL